MSKNKHDVVIRAVESLRSSEFGATAIKVELEAGLNRRDYQPDDDCSYCEGGRSDCDNCSGTGDAECERCEGSGEHGVTDEYGDEHDVTCARCDGSGETSCSECDGEGNVDCPECDGCSECDGEVANFSLDAYCHNFLMSKLEPLGLAENTPDAGNLRLSHGVNTTWRPKGALKYAEFYNDGSVDSEFTFTLMLNESENIFLLPKIIEIWNSLAEAIGFGQNVEGAGMHMALINSPTGIYPSAVKAADVTRFKNFRKSMQLLIPALYFLGSTDETSRGLNYRRPQIGSDVLSDGGKYSAVSFRGGAIEFRLFNTCYETPEAILDNVVVMGNAMRHWTTIYTPHNLRDIVPRVQFGNENDNTLKRFYVTCEHIDLLNAGLKRLKPSYMTITEIKKQRNFSVTKNHINSATDTRRKEAEVEYKEYEERFNWNKVMRRHRWTADLLDSRLSINGLPTNGTEVLREVEHEVEQEVSRYEGTKKSFIDYVNEAITEFTNRSAGDYILEEN